MEKSDARSDAHEWSNYNQTQSDSNNSWSSTLGSEQTVWRKPAEGWLKCNVDGSFKNSGVPARGGWVVRDSNGMFVTAGHEEGMIVYSALEAEFQALLMAIQFCWCQGYTRVIFEGDNKKMIDILKSKALQFGLYNWVREIRWCMD
uniref:RNase H type-1 domain-containing protein n=1 Tax=Brassica oleracea var. oleracea TaxID=109376 RepID=A0A0D3D909_BRAOL